MPYPVHPNVLTLRTLQMATYALPFVFFYAIGHLVESLKQKATATTTLESWLVRHNQDHVMQFGVLAAVLLGWLVFSSLTHWLRRKTTNPARATTLAR